MSRKRWGRIFFLCVTCVEIICISILGYIVIQKRGTPHSSVSFIEKKDFQFPVDTALTYYYEPGINDTSPEQPYWLSKPAIYTTNSDGLFERYDYPVQKLPHTYRIITIGDSFTEGIYVDTGNNYSERLEDMLNTTAHCRNISHFEVINLGVAGYDMRYILERFKRKGVKYDPDLVIYLSLDNDFTEDNEVFHEVLSHLDGKETIENDKVYFDSPQYNREANIAMQLKHFRTFLDMVPHSFLLFTLHSLMPTDIRLLLHQTLFGKPSMYMDVETKQYDAFPDGHPTEKGHELFAQLLYDYLITNKVIPCL